MKDVIALLLAGGVGSRLNILARRRAKPAVPFAGSYRIIDFTLSNVMAAGIGRVGVLTQYRPVSLQQHLGNGMAWDLWGKTKVLRVLPPYQGQNDTDWYRGTADAVYQNLDFVERHDPEFVLILSGDHVYRMDYADMIRFHREKRAAVTIAVMPVPWEEASRFGLLSVDSDNRVTEFEEKPKRPRFNLASMGVYVFDRAALESGLRACCPSGGFDFGKEVIPHLFVRAAPVFAYPFHGYWRDVGTIQSYWEANMDVFADGAGIDLGSWRVRTNADADGSSNLPSSWLSGTATVHRSIVSRGCVIEGTVEHSVLSPGVRVGRGAVVRDSIVMHGSVIGDGAVVDRSILDKAVVVGAGALIGDGPADRPNQAWPEHLNTGLTVVGKEARLPRGVRVGRNCFVFPGLRENRFPGGQLETGGTLESDVPG
jgi:glucose-1-phosphate adenylyltransferase